MTVKRKEHLCWQVLVGIWFLLSSPLSCLHAWQLGVVIRPCSWLSRHPTAPAAADAAPAAADAARSSFATAAAGSRPRQRSLFPTTFSSFRFPPTRRKPFCPKQWQLQLSAVNDDQPNDTTTTNNNNNDNNNNDNNNKNIDNNNNNNNNNNNIQTKNNDNILTTLIQQDPSRWYRLRLPRAMGIDWGTDLSFAYVMVRGMDPTGPAAASGRVQVGDQLCQLTPVVDTGKEPTEEALPIGLIGAPFDYVMTAFAELDRTVIDVDLVFFRGTKADLQQAVAAATGQSADLAPETITVTVIQNKGSPDEQVRVLRQVPAGVNVRELLVNNGINVYQSITRWTNCKGKQLCGTCIVNVTDGALQTNRKSMDEASTLRENPETYRLSCVTFAYGDVTVETFPPIQAAQWTR